MRPDRKQIVNGLAAFVAVLFTFRGLPGGDMSGGGQSGFAAHAAELYGSPEGAIGKSTEGKRRGTAGGVSIGDGVGGVTDRAFVTAPPHYSYVVEKERGSFLDCGEGQDYRVADEDGRDEAMLRCGVTLTETVVIPAAASSARIIIHF